MAKKKSKRDPAFSSLSKARQEAFMKKHRAAKQAQRTKASLEAVKREAARNRAKKKAASTKKTQAFARRKVKHV